MNKKDPFWIIIGITSTICIIAGIAISYFKISKYSELQNFPEDFKEQIDLLDTARKSNELPKNDWIEKAQQIDKNLDDTLAQMKELMAPLESNKDIKHYKFFDNIAKKTKYNEEYQLTEVTDRIRCKQIVSKLEEWVKKLTDLSAESVPQSNLGKLLKDWQDYNPDTEKELINSLLNLNKNYLPHFEKTYRNLLELLKEIKDITTSFPEEKERENAALKNFQILYNTLIPSLLLTQYIVDNIPEFSNVNLKSVYISSYNPIKSSMIKSFKPFKSSMYDNKQITTLSQVTLYSCFLDSIQPTNPKQQKKSILLNSMKSRYWDIMSEKQELPADNKDPQAYIEKSLTSQFSVYPKELGTTIPVVFIFSSSYRNFLNLIKALNKINDISRNDRKNILEEVGVTIPLPITISKILFTLKNNIESSHFTLRRELQFYPDTPDGNKNWLEEKEKQYNKKVEEIKNIVNTDFTFLVEVLVFLYDPGGLTECWNNIPNKSKGEKPKDEKSNR